LLLRRNLVETTILTFLTLPKLNVYVVQENALQIRDFVCPSVYIRKSSEVFTEMKIEVVVFWLMTTCTGVVRFQCFGEQCCLHLQGDSEVLRNTGILPHYYTASKPRRLRIEPLTRFEPRTSPVRVRLGIAPTNISACAYFNVTTLNDNIVCFNETIHIAR